MTHSSDGLRLSRDKGFRHALLVTIVFQGATLGLSAALILLLSRWLGADGKGLQALLMTAAQVASVLFGLGFSASIPSVVGSDHSRAPALVRNLAGVMLVAAVLVAGMALANRALVFAPWLHGYEVICGLFALSLIALTAFTNLLLATNRTWQFNVATLLTAAVTLVYVIAARLAGALDVHVSLTALTVGTLVGLVYVLLIMRADGLLFQGRVTPLDLRSQGRIAFLGYTSTVFGLLLFRGDVFLVNALGGHLRGAGVYSVAVFAAEMAVKIPQWAATLLTPAVASNQSQASSRTIRLFWLSIAFSSALFLGALLLRGPAESLFGKTLGPSFAGASLVMLAVFPRVVLQAGGAIFAGNLAGKGFTLWHPGATLGGMFAVFGLDFLLVPRYGPVGGGIASSIGFLVTFFLLFAGFLQHNNVQMKEFFRESFAYAELLAGRAKHSTRS